MLGHTQTRANFFSSGFFSILKVRTSTTKWRANKTNDFVKRVSNYFDNLRNVLCHSPISFLLDSFFKRPSAWLMMGKIKASVTLVNRPPR